MQLSCIKRRDYITGVFELAGFEVREPRDRLDDAANGLAAIERRGRTAYYFESLDGGCRHKCEPGRWCCAEHGVAESHAVDKVEDRRAFQAADYRRTLTGRCLLDVHTGNITQCIRRQFCGGDRIGAGR